MKPISIEEIEKCLEQGNVAEAKKLLEAYYAMPLDKTQDAHVRVALVVATMKLMNSFNKTYSEALAEAIELTKEIKDAKKKADEGAKLAQVRAELN